MKYLHKFNESISRSKSDEIHRLTRSIILGDYILYVSNEGVVDISPVNDALNACEDLSPYGRTLGKLPIKIGKVQGRFVVTESQLTTLEGFPDSISGFLMIRICNKLKSLKGCTQVVGGMFYLNNCLLVRTLEGGPTQVLNDYVCSNNKLTSLVGAPEICTSSFDCSRNDLADLTGAPTRVERNFTCAENLKLTSLEGVPRYIGWVLDVHSCHNLWDPSHLRDVDCGSFTYFETPLECLLKIFGESFRESLDYNYIRGVVRSKYPTINLFRFKEALDEFNIDYMSLFDRGWDGVSDRQTLLRSGITREKWEQGPYSAYQCKYNPWFDGLQRWIFVDNDGRFVNFHGEQVDPPRD